MRHYSTFESARLKLERADKHIVDLNDLLKSFIQQYPNRPSIHGDRDEAGRWVMRVVIEHVEPIPSEAAVIFGDAIHNLRCALDHAVWELFALDGGAQDRWTKLPTGRGVKDYESSIDGMKTPRLDTKTFLKQLAIFPGGIGVGDTLYGLNMLDNADKHTVIVPIAHWSSIGGIVTIAPNGKKHPVDIIDSGPTADRSVDIFTALPGFGIDANEQFSLAYDVLLGEAEAFDGEPVLPVLCECREAVNDALGQFSAFVTNRP